MLPTELNRFVWQMRLVLYLRQRQFHLICGTLNYLNLLMKVMAGVSPNAADRAE